MSIGGHHSHRAGKDEWLTPPEIVEAVGTFDLDPCSPINRPWPTAARHLTIEEDGLAQPWEGLVWMNPPYGRATGEWLRKLADHPDGGIALIFARTETSFFCEQVWGRADALLFIAGRLHFHHVDGSRASANAGGPSALVAFGPTAVGRLHRSGIGGAIVYGWTNVHAPHPSQTRVIS